MQTSFLTSLTMILVVALFSVALSLPFMHAYAKLDPANDLDLELIQLYSDAQVHVNKETGMKCAHGEMSAGCPLGKVS